jgi:hypothetical protein
MELVEAIQRQAEETLGLTQDQDVGADQRQTHKAETVDQGL